MSSSTGGHDSALATYKTKRKRPGMGRHSLCWLYAVSAALLSGSKWGSKDRAWAGGSGALTGKAEEGGSGALTAERLGKMARQMRPACEGTAAEG